MTADVSAHSMRVHSHPHDVWFNTEVEAITAGLLTRRDAPADEYVGKQMHTLTRVAVRVLARRGEPFTVADLWQVIEHREIPIPQGTTTADLVAVWRRLRRHGAPSTPTRAESGGRA